MLHSHRNATVDLAIYCVLLIFTLRPVIASQNSTDSGTEDIATQDSDASDLPHGLASMCIGDRSVDQGRQLVTISCQVTSDDTWEFDIFRNWTSGLEGVIDVELDLSCSGNGKICLPWPYRAHRLSVLKVFNCINDCYYGDYHQVDYLKSIPDSLRVLETYGVTVKVDFLYLLSLPETHLEPVIDCGPLNVEIFINRRSKNIVQMLEEIDMPSDENVTNGFVKKVQSYNDVEHECRYNNMRVYDVSQRVNASSTSLYTAVVNSKFPQLQVLNLSDTEQQKFPDILTTWRLRFTKLKTLDLSRNNISRFDLRDFSLVSSEPGKILLRVNNIKTIGVQEIHSFAILDGAVIDIRDNPFECNCAMADFSAFLQRHKNPREAKIHQNYSYLWNLQCKFPTELKDLMIADLTRQRLCSTDVSHYIALICSFSLVVVILIIIIIIMTKYRKEIRILAFTRLHIVLPCQPKENCEQKRYDAFVSYSHHDYKWVVYTLLPKLEGGEGVAGNFRLCLHQRDFEVGAAVADNIVQSIEASRHTILVLSKKFLESEWCLMEFRTAFRQSLVEKKKHLILVLLEDIPTHDLESDLRRCMQTWTYMHTSDSLFWDRLVYSLTDKSKTKWSLFKRGGSQESGQEVQQDFQSFSKLKSDICSPPVGNQIGSTDGDSCDIDWDVYY